MTESPTPANVTFAVKIGADHVTAWMTCGWRRVARDKPLWFGMGLVYVTIGLLLEQIPFMGHLVLILLTPMWLASIVLMLQGQETSIVTNAAFQGYLLQPARQLFQIFGNEEKIVSVVTLSIIVLGLVMLVKIIGYLMVGGSMVSGLTATDVTTLRLPLLLGTLAVSILYFALTLALLYSVPLTVLANRLPLLAIAESFSTCKRHIKPLALFTIVLIALPYIVIIAIFNTVTWLGYLLLAGAGMFILPVVVASAYCSYQTFYSAESAPFLANH